MLIFEFICVNLRKSASDKSFSYARGQYIKKVTKRSLNSRYAFGYYF